MQHPTCNIRHATSDMHIHPNYIHRHEPSISLINYIDISIGLIGLHLAPAYAGAGAISTSPSTFLGDPAVWMRMMAQWKATKTAGPNFAFVLAARKAKASETSSLDLSGVDFILNGAEPISAAGIDAFAAHYAPAGLRLEVICPGKCIVASLLLASSC